MMKDYPADSNVDALFEQQNVGNIDKEFKRILSVIEEKREELRSLVGGRYRDLLQAANTITTMEDSSTALIQELDGVAKTCDYLNERQLIGFKSPVCKEIEENVANKPMRIYFSTLLQIKFLTVSAELIWSHIDAKCYSEATALFLLSRHMITGLRLDTQNPFKHQLHVGMKQWSMLRSYYSIIKYYVTGELKGENLNKNNVADYLLSLLLLDNTDLNLILKRFLEIRFSTYLQRINNKFGDQNEGLLRKYSPKDRILASLQILIDSVEIVNSCFLENQMLLLKLKELSVAKGYNLSQLLDDKDAHYVHYLPEVIGNFQIKYEAKEFDTNQAVEDINNWLSSVNDAQHDLLNSIKQINTLQMVEDVKQAAYTYQNLHKFANIEETYKSLHGINFYTWIYSPLLSQRFCELIVEQWSVAVDTALKGIKQHFEHLSMQEMPIIWKESVNELPATFGAISKLSYNEKKLLMTSKGYNMSILEQCQLFDKQLVNVVEQIDTLMQGDITSEIEKNNVVEMLYKTSQTELSKLFENVRALALNSKQRRELIFLALYWASFIEMCPNLEYCFSANYKYRRWMLKKNNEDMWKACCDHLQEESLFYWYLFLEDTINILPVDRFLKTSCSDHDLLQDCVSWVAVNAVQDMEAENNTPSSTFRIPCQPCISLQLFLFEIIGTLNSAVPQTLPARVLEEFNFKLLKELLKVYAEKLDKNLDDANITKETKSSLNENAALQMYFDLYFLQEFFGPTLQKKAALKADLNGLKQNSKALIDPIDFELFFDHIVENVNCSKLRLNSQFGVLTPVYTSEKFVNKERHPNVLALSNSSLWFSLLPVVSLVDKSNTSNEKTNAHVERRVLAQKDVSLEKNVTTKLSASPFFW